MSDSTIFDMKFSEVVEVGGSGGSVDLTGYATEKWVENNYQPKGDYLTEIPDNQLAQAVEDYMAEHPIEVPDSGGNVDQSGGLTTAQIEALDGMFKVCAFTKDDISAEYSAFVNAFGIEDSGNGEDGNETPYYPFTNGVCSVVDNAGVNVGSITITNDNHINMTRTYTYDCTIPASNLPESITLRSLGGQISNQNTMFSLKTGDVVRTVVNFSDTNAHTAGVSVRLVTAGAATTTEIMTSITESGENTYTMSSDLDVGGIGVYLASGQDVLDCDIEIYVNGIKYV